VNWDVDAAASRRAILYLSDCAHSGKKLALKWAS
jgi:hypothetical protein